MSNTALTDFAEELLLSGKDRIPHRFDRRSEQRLLRTGLLKYPDGRYSLTDGAIENAALTWRVISRDPHCSPERREAFDQLIALAKRWHEPRDVEHDFGGLSARQYQALWEVVTHSSRTVVLVAPDMTKIEQALWARLESRGLVAIERKATTLFIRATPEGDRLVSDLGPPPRH